MTTTLLATMFVARVIFAEAGNASREERELVASVIYNRVGHPGFGKPKTIKDVCTKDQFKCIGDAMNDQWVLSFVMSQGYRPNRKAFTIFKECNDIADGNFKRNPNVLFYHDKSISMPESWKKNKYYKITKEIETEKFIFYKAEKLK